MGPRPSIVGTPAPAVVLPSEAPPVAASRRLNPSSAASRAACSTSRPEASVRSMGQCRDSSSTRPLTSGMVERSAMAVMAASRASRSARWTARTSISRVVRSGTMFGRVPPLMAPTLTVAPGTRPSSSCRATTLWAASSTALRPFSGSTPAWAARPWMSMRTCMLPLRADTMSPFSRAASSTRAMSADAACSSISGVLTGEPISSSGLTM